jgi:hypothetical protein
VKIMVKDSHRKIEIERIAEVARVASHVKFLRQIVITLIAIILPLLLSGIYMIIRIDVRIDNNEKEIHDFKTQNAEVIRTTRVADEELKQDIRDLGIKTDNLYLLKKNGIKILSQDPPEESFRN